MIWPEFKLMPLVTIHPLSVESLANFTLVSGNQPLLSSSSQVWPTANKAIFVPFQVFTQINVLKMFCYNGATVSGNVDVGIYDITGKLIVAKGSTAMSGANAIQEFDITDTVLLPGAYYMAMSVDNATAAFFRNASGNIQYDKAVGMAEQTSAFALPATATLATITSDYIPQFGLSTRSVI